MECYHVVYVNYVRGQEEVYEQSCNFGGYQHLMWLASKGRIKIIKAE